MGKDSERVEELIHQVGKLALEEGELWRLEHVELMDSYNSILEEKGGES